MNKLILRTLLLGTFRNIPCKSTSDVAYIMFHIYDREISKGHLIYGFDTDVITNYKAVAISINEHYKSILQNRSKTLLLIHELISSEDFHHCKTFYNYHLNLMHVEEGLRESVKCESLFQLYNYILINGPWTDDQIELVTIDFSDLSAAINEHVKLQKKS